jgi:membrane-associated phospholipid phosphatase
MNCFYVRKIRFFLIALPLRFIYLTVLILSLLIDIQSFDIQLFKNINHDWTNSFFDNVLPFVRESVIWTPLYLFLVAFAWQNFGKQGWYFILFAVLTVVISNFISSDLIKNWVNRPRPCRTPGLDHHLLLNRCPISGSFTSSHATNHFAMAMFLFQTLRFTVKWAWVFFIWAFIIIYAQVYVGVHFPVDVIAGALLGSFIGHTMAMVFHYRQGFLKPVTATQL